MVALVEIANIANGKIRMIKLPSIDIDKIVLVMLPEFDRITILINNDIWKSRRIIDMSTTLLSQEKHQALAVVHAFSWIDYVSSFF